VPWLDLAWRGTSRRSGAREEKAGAVAEAVVGTVAQSPELSPLLPAEQSLESVAGRRNRAEQGGHQGRQEKRGRKDPAISDLVFYISEYRYSPYETPPIMVLLVQDCSLCSCVMS
jgi:hypothetical protein